MTPEFDEEDWSQSIGRLDKKLENALLEILSNAPVSSQELAKEVGLNVLRVEHCLDLLEKAHIAKFVPHPKGWGWIRIHPPKK